MKTQLRVWVHRYNERVWRRFWGERFRRRFPKGRGQEIQTEAWHWLHCLVSLKMETLATTLFFRMDEPNPRPEDIYKRPEELFNHPKPPQNYGESQNPTNNKKRQRFQSNLGTHRGKKPWQVSVHEIYRIAMMTKSISYPMWLCQRYGHDIFAMVAITGSTNIRKQKLKL